MKEQHKTSLQQWLIQIISQPKSTPASDYVGVNMEEWVTTEDEANFCCLCLGGRLVYQELAKSKHIDPKFRVSLQDITDLTIDISHKPSTVERLAGYIVSGEEAYDTPLFFTDRWPTPWRQLYEDRDFLCDVIFSINNTLLTDPLLRRVPLVHVTYEFLQPALFYCLLDELTEDDKGSLKSLWKLRLHTFMFDQDFEDYKLSVNTHFKERHSETIHKLSNAYLKALAS
jgi:hypothetical protein